jgi:hypothetical protein
MYFFRITAKSPISQRSRGLFNEREGKAIPVIYGCVTSGKLWQFLKIEGKDVTIDVNEYSIDWYDRILGILKWMVSEID